MASHAMLYKLLLACIVGLFFVDFLFLHYLTPWSDTSSKSNRVMISLVSDAELDPEHEKPGVDIRSRANFDGRFVPRAATPTIPTIIHQTWDTEQIPKAFHKWIVTWKKHNPDWQYWFWSLDEVRKFLSKEYPWFLKIYDVYTDNIFRSDAMRYFVLHKYGGIYMDLDMEALKPLDNWTRGFNCIVSEETYEHQFVVREADAPANIVNGFIASRPGHPLLKLAIDSLEEFSGFYFGDYLHATGPFFFSAILERYLAKLGQNSNLSSDTDDVTIVPPKYFFPTYDPSESDLITQRCFPGKYQLLKEPAQITCKELLKTFLRRVPVAESYTDHHWMHAYMFDPEWKLMDTKHIVDIVPDAIVHHV